jgi:hypothetical protein
MEIWLLIAWASAAWACEDAGALVAELETAVVEARLEHGEALLSRIEASYGCSDLASEEVLGRMWLAEGVLLSMGGDEAGAQQSFAAAARVAPAGWRNEYGTRFQSQYEAARGLPSPGAANIHLTPFLGGNVGAIDGRRVDFPAEVSGGLHLIQAGPKPGPMAFSRIALLSEGEELTLQTGLPMPAPLSTPAAVTVQAQDITKTKERKRAPVFLIAGGTAGALSAVTAVLAVQQTSKMRNAENPDGLDKAYLQQQAFGISSYTLAGLAVTGTVLHFAF